MLNQSMNKVLTEVVELLAKDGTTWHFIPPKAPNFGGLSEAGVKSVKTHLAKTIGASTLTFEEMSTLLNQIEACLNSRPIGQLNDHPDDLTPLTPAHFLIGEPLITIPDFTDDNEWISPLNRWKLTQRIMSNFWNRWSEEFLHNIHIYMQQRNKWQTKTIPPQIGDIAGGIVSGKFFGSLLYGYSTIGGAILPPAETLTKAIKHSFSLLETQLYTRLLLFLTKTSFSFGQRKTLFRHSYTLLTHLEEYPANYCF